MFSPARLRFIILLILIVTCVIGMSLFSMQVIGFTIFYVALILLILLLAKWIYEVRIRPTHNEGQFEAPQKVFSATSQTLALSENQGRDVPYIYTQINADAAIVGSATESPDVQETQEVAAEDVAVELETQETQEVAAEDVAVESEIIELQQIPSAGSAQSTKEITDYLPQPPKMGKREIHILSGKKIANSWVNPFIFILNTDKSRGLFVGIPLSEMEQKDLDLKNINIIIEIDGQIAEYKLEILSIDKQKYGEVTINSPFETLQIYSNPQIRALRQNIELNNPFNDTFYFFYSIHNILRYKWWLKGIESYIAVKNTHTLDKSIKCVEKESCPGLIDYTLYKIELEEELPLVIVEKETYQRIIHFRNLSITENTLFSDSLNEKYGPIYSAEDLEITPNDSDVGDSQFDIEENVIVTIENLGENSEPITFWEGSPEQVNGRYILPIEKLLRDEGIYEGNLRVTFRPNTITQSIRSNQLLMRLVRGIRIEPNQLNFQDPIFPIEPEYEQLAFKTTFPNNWKLRSTTKGMEIGNIITTNENRIAEFIATKSITQFSCTFESQNRNLIHFAITIPKLRWYFKEDSKNEGKYSKFNCDLIRIPLSDFTTHRLDYQKFVISWGIPLPLYYFSIKIQYFDEGPKARIIRMATFGKSYKILNLIRYSELFEHSNKDVAISLIIQKRDLEEMPRQVPLIKFLLGPSMPVSRIFPDEEIEEDSRPIEIFVDEITRSRQRSIEKHELKDFTRKISENFKSFDTDFRDYFFSTFENVVENQIDILIEKHQFGLINKPKRTLEKFLLSSLNSFLTQIVETNISFRNKPVGLIITRKKLHSSKCLILEWIFNEKCYLIFNIKTINQPEPDVARLVNEIKTYLQIENVIFHKVGKNEKFYCYIKNGDKLDNIASDDITDIEKVNINKIMSKSSKIFPYDLNRLSVKYMHSIRVIKVAFKYACRLICKFSDYFKFSK